MTRTRYDAAQVQLRKCVLLAGADSASAPRSEDDESSASAACCIEALDPHNESVVLQATAQLSLLMRVSGGPLKGTQALRASLEALLSIRRLPACHDVARGGGRGGGGGDGSRQRVPNANLAAWQAVAESLKGLTKELATLPAGLSLAGHKEVKKETLKDLYRQALRLSPLDNEAHVANIQEMLMALAALIA